MKTLTRHDIIREVIADTGYTDPRDIAKIVAERTPEHMLREWYEQAIIPDIRAEHLRRRKQSANAKVAAVVAKAERAGRKVSARTKADLVRETWLSKVSAGVSVNGEWKRLADCSYDEVLRLEEARYEAADDVRAEGQRFGKLAAAMSEHGVLTAGELPAEVGLAIL